jgi:hypothetical protein
MGRRSKADLYDVVGRILDMHGNDKLSIQQISDILKSEGLDMSRESVRRSLKGSKELAADMRKATEEARIMIDSVRDSANTDIAEAVVTRFGGLLLREAQNIDALEFDDPGKAVQAAGRLADAQVKLGKLRLQFQDGFEAAKKAVLAALRMELKEHPDILERLTMLVGGLEADEK